MVWLMANPIIASRAASSVLLVSPIRRAWIRADSSFASPPIKDQ